MIGENDDSKRTFSYVLVFVLFIVLSLGVGFLIFFALNRPVPVPSSSSEQSSSEEVVSSEEEISSSIYDTYIDDVISNIKKYIKDVGDTMSTSWTVKDIYAVNYVGSELYYGFTITEESDKYLRLDMDLEVELTSIDEVVAMIHDNGVKVDMYVAHDMYTIVDEDITSKSSFKDVYPGTYNHKITYKNMYDHYMSGIGVNDGSYVSIDQLLYDPSTWDINNTDTYVNSDGNSGHRYYQLLSALAK